MVRKRYLRVTIILCLSVFFCFALNANTVKTPAEKSNYTKYSQNEDIARFLSQVDHASKEVKVQIIGKSKATDNYDAKDLFLCIITEEGMASPQTINRAKPTLLLIASQHGNEQSAKEAALWFIRDLAIGELKPLLKKVNFLIIPQANPYGNTFDQRRNEQDLDLNRDHVKIESPEVEAIHRAFRMWMPEITMDIHEKGDDYYRVSIGCVSNPNIHSQLQDFSRKTLLAEVETNLKKKKISFQEYLVTQRMGIDSSAGVRYGPEELEDRERMWRYSTTDLNDGRNSLGIYETFSFIQEGASQNDIPTLLQRTRWQYYGIRFFSESVARHGEDIITLVGSLREELLEKAKHYSEDDLVHLRMIYIRNRKQPTLNLKTFEKPDIPIQGVLKEDKKAGDVLTEADISPYPHPLMYKVVDEEVQNWFPDVEPTISIPRPLGYIIPAKYQDVVETLLCHRLKVEIFIKDLALQVETYTVTDVIPATYDYLPPQSIQVEKKELQTIIKKGDFYIATSQQGANLIPCLLEPQSQYGLIRYWKFKLVPEKNDIFPFYRLVKEEKLPIIPFKDWKR